MVTDADSGYITGEWIVDTAHSDITYAVKHLGLARSRGKFTEFTGIVVTAPNILDSSVTVEISSASVASGDEYRNTHVRSEEFFDVDRHPTITFRSTGIREHDDDYIIDGELTWHGRTVPVSLATEFNGSIANPLNDSAITLGASATTTVNRRDFGIGPEGNALLSEKVTIDIELQAVLRS